MPAVLGTRGKGERGASFHRLQKQWCFPAALGLWSLVLTFWSAGLRGPGPPGRATTGPRAQGECLQQAHGWGGVGSLQSANTDPGGPRVHSQLSPLRQTERTCRWQGACRAGDSGAQPSPKPESSAWTESPARLLVQLRLKCPVWTRSPPPMGGETGPPSPQPPPGLRAAHGAVGRVAQIPTQDVSCGIARDSLLQVLNILTLPPAGPPRCPAGRGSQGPGRLPGQRRHRGDLPAHFPKLGLPMTAC